MPPYLYVSVLTKAGNRWVHVLIKIQFFFKPWNLVSIYMYKWIYISLYSIYFMKFQHIIIPIYILKQTINGIQKQVIKLMQICLPKIYIKCERLFLLFLIHGSHNFHSQSPLLVILKDEIIPEKKQSKYYHYYMEV